MRVPGAGLSRPNQSAGGPALSLLMRYMPCANVVLSEESGARASLAFGGCLRTRKAVDKAAGHHDCCAVEAVDCALEEAPFFVSARVAVAFLNPVERIV